MAFLTNLSFDEISKYGFIRTFCAISESYNPFSFRNVRKNVVESVVSAKNMCQSLNAIRS